MPRMRGQSKSGETGLNQLEALFKELNAKEGQDFHPGVYTRLEWTVRFLKERVGQ